MAKVTAQLVKQLRDRTGARLLDCQKALIESDGDLEKAIAWLRQKDLIRGQTIGNRPVSAAEGLIQSYIHTAARIGVLVEVNCQTDFVAKNSAFRELAKNIALQIAASEVEYVSVEDIPLEVVEYERAILGEAADLADKPAELRAKIIAGRLNKRLKEMTLLDQSYIRDPAITVDELIRLNMATLGETIQVRRFARFSLGEYGGSAPPPSSEPGGTSPIQPQPQPNPDPLSAAAEPNYI